MSGSPTQRAETTSGRAMLPGSRSRHDSGWQLASPASSVGDWFADRRLPMNSEGQREDAGEAGDAMAVPGLADVAEQRVSPPGMPAADGEQREFPGAQSSSFVAALPAPDSPGLCHGSDDEDLGRDDRRTGSRGAGRLRGEDRLEALAAVLAAAEAGSGDGASQCTASAATTLIAARPRHRRCPCVAQCSSGTCIQSQCVPRLHA